MVNLPGTSFLIKLVFLFQQPSNASSFSARGRTSCPPPLSMQRLGLYWASKELRHRTTITVSSWVHLSFCVLRTLFPLIHRPPWVNGFPNLELLASVISPTPEKITSSSPCYWSFQSSLEGHFYWRYPVLGHRAWRY